MKKSKENFVWRSPSMGWIKVNFHGVPKGNPKTIGSGGVLRDDRVRFISMMTLPWVPRKTIVLKLR